MAVVLKGSEVVAAMKEKMAARVAELTAKGIRPCLGIVRVGTRPDDIAYERSAVKRCDSSGVSYKLFEFTDDIGSAEFISEFRKINEDATVHGLLVLRPLPRHIDEDAVKNIIDPKKDIDCMSPANTAKVFAGDDTGFAPCTPEAVIEMLDHFGVDVQGKRVVVIGRSMIVGRPLSMLLLKRHATITVCHTRTRNIEEICRNAEILVAAAGKAGMVDERYISEGCVVVDVGINIGADGKLCGDVDYESVYPKASMISPVPGGVGSVTTSVLINHVIAAAALS